MKKIALLAAAMLALTAHAQTYVDGYYRKDGIYVPGHMRSAPDSSRMNNYGAQNSIYGANPYTGQRGSQRDELSPPQPFILPGQQNRPSCKPDIYGRVQCF